MRFIPMTKTLYSVVMHSYATLRRDYIQCCVYVCVCVCVCMCVRV